jgi:nitrile hydratase subunit beta
MARINDVGGVEGFGPIDTTENTEPFHADWEARVYALTFSLLARGLYNLDEFRDAIERLPPARYLHASYYEKWLAAVETLRVERGVLATEALEEALRA